VFVYQTMDFGLHLILKGRVRPCLLVQR